MGLLLVVALHLVAVGALTVPLTCFVAGPTLCHLLQLFYRHLELVFLEEGTPELVIDIDLPVFNLLLCPLLLGLLCLQRWGVGLLLLLEVGVQDLCRLVLLQSIFIANLRHLLGVVVLSISKSLLIRVDLLLVLVIEIGSHVVCRCSTLGRILFLRSNLSLRTHSRMFGGQMDPREKLR